MTLLESLIAMVIVSLAAVGLLELFHVSNRGAADTREWVMAIAYAEEGLEAAKGGRIAMSAASSHRQADGLSREIRVIPFRDGVDDVVVTVRFSRGGSYTLHRLVPR